MWKYSQTGKAAGGIPLDVTVFSYLNIILESFFSPTFGCDELNWYPPLKTLCSQSRPVLPIHKKKDTIMKQRFSSLDVRVIASELAAALVSLRIANIYDLSSRIFLFKLAKPGKREQLIVDSGFRCHLTSFTRTAASTPSPFVSRLRKYLKSRRVTGVKQIGTDRVIEISFSEGQYRLYLEFFAAGNIILTDVNLNVLALLRQVNEDNEDYDVKVGGKYVLHAKQNYNGIPTLEEQRVKDVLQQATDRVKKANEVGGKKAKRAKGADSVTRALSAGFPEFPIQLIDHVFIQTKVDSGWKIDDVQNDPDKTKQVMQALSMAEEIFKSLGTGQSQGYIIAKTKEQPSEDFTTESAHVQPRDALLYEDFHPFKPSQFEDVNSVRIIDLDTFNKTVDEFYSSVESQRLESKLTEREETAKKRLQSAKDEHERRLGALQQVQELHIRKAQAIEANTHRVEEACAAVNGLIGQGMDWVDIGKLIANEQGRGNVVAQLVKLPLKLEENTVTLLLDEQEYEDEDEGYKSEEDDRTDSEYDSDDVASVKPATTPAEKRLSIDIDLAITPWQNARQYYDQKKVAAVKEQKTMQASSKALRSTEQKIQADLKKGLKQEKDVLRPSRRAFWFEKFLWFVSSDGYLVLGGKDAQQNELLYRRYLKKGDIYVHADLNGASSVIVKNNSRTPDAPIPPSTLSQAGALTVCTSSAWDSKAVMAAWWVNAEQVSKTAPTGEYLTTGGFLVRGKKNFLPPSQLLLGFGVMWLISEGSRTNHGRHRLAKTESLISEEVESLDAETRGLLLSQNDAPGQETTEEKADAVSDIEEAGEQGEQEVQDDDEAAQSVAEDDEVGSEHEQQDEESRRTNPLQSKDKAQMSSALNDDDNAGPSSAADHSSSSSEEDEEPIAAGTSTPASSAPSTQTSKPAQLARGKRSKAKRAAKRYAEQDDEDRALAMSLLGSAQAEQHKVDVEEDKAARQAKADADKERRRKQHQQAAEREQKRQQRIEAGEVGEDEEQDAEQLEQERAEHDNIDLLVPAPEPGDELIAAIPVVAPWQAMARMKYKVKLQPGSAKKGKAVKEIMAMWTGLASKGRKVVDEENRDRERVWSREVELIKGWRVEEVVGSVPVKGCRVVQGGGLVASAGGSGGGRGGKGGARGGKGSKKGR